MAPFLALGGVVALFAGEALLDAYLALAELLALVGLSPLARGYERERGGRQVHVR
ncbi:MAG: hypothetical protein M3Q31_19615 [Actinomycetota bacterium]|nr:hypothetical protein [Actinomycetota bacterium]